MRLGRHLASRSSIALVGALMAGCSAREVTIPPEAIQPDATRPDVPFVSFYRARSNAPKSTYGPVVAVWPDRRIVRAAFEDQIGEAYVAGTLSAAQFDDLRKLIASKGALFRLPPAPLIVDAAHEELGIRLKDYRIHYLETWGDFPQIQHHPEVAALRAYLMRLKILDPQPAAMPWQVPPRDWYRDEARPRGTGP